MKINKLLKSKTLCLPVGLPTRGTKAGRQVFVPACSLPARGTKAGRQVFSF